MIRSAALVLSVLPMASWACDVPPSAVPFTTPDSTPPILYAVIEEIVVSRPFDMRVFLCTDTVDALHVDAIMPRHQHGMNYTPQVARTGPGRFTVTGLVFHMPGLWQIQVEARGLGLPRRFTLETDIE